MKVKLAFAGLPGSVKLGTVTRREADAGRRSRRCGLAKTGLLHVANAEVTRKVEVNAALPDKQQDHNCDADNGEEPHEVEKCKHKNLRNVMIVQ